MASETATLAPRCCEKQSAGHAGLPQPDHQHAFALNIHHDFRNSVIRDPPNIVARHCATFRGHYLNFNVVRAKSANTSDAIQKRTMTFDSLQPINSKW